MSDEQEFPTLQDWLLMQLSRSDSVGMFARLMAANLAEIREDGFEAWLQDIRDGKVLDFAIEELFKEHARCINELKATGHSSSFPAWKRLKASERKHDELWKKYKDEPHISVESHLHQIQKKIWAQLRGQSIIYIDTNHWIRMRDVLMGAEGRLECYEKILDRLRELRRARRIICPFSFPLFLELRKQKSDATRRAMAALMDELSDCICIQPPHELEKIELKEAFLFSILGENGHDLQEWVWTKAIWFLGIQLIDHPTCNEAQNCIMGKIFLDDCAEHRISDLVEFYSDGEITDYKKAMAEAYNTDAKYYRDKKMTHAQVLQYEKAQLFNRVVKKHTEKIGMEVYRQFPVQAEAKAKSGELSMEPSHMNLPSLQVLAGVHASYIADTPTMHFETNDLVDIDHAVVAVPYCHAFFTERALAHRLKTKPLELDKLYKIGITSEPEEFLSWLNAIA